MNALVALLFSITANAGWFSNWCEKHIIADDPTQFESTPSAWIERKIYVLEIQKTNGVASRADLRLLKSLKAELKRRGDDA